MHCNVHTGMWIVWVFLFLFLKFCILLFLLAYITYTKGFHCVISVHAYNALWSYSPLLLLFFYNFNVSLCNFHAFIQCISIVFLPPSPLHFFLPCASAGCLPNIPILYSWCIGHEYICELHILINYTDRSSISCTYYLFKSRYCIWDKAWNICLLSLGGVLFFLEFFS
jgi:hypothetical protein